MKALIYLLLSLLLITYSCSPSELEEKSPALSNNQQKVKDLIMFARECGYTDLTINISKPLTDSDIKIYKSLIERKAKTRRYISQYMYLSKISYKRHDFPLQLDYSRNGDTKQILEAYGGVEGVASNSYYDIQMALSLYPANLTIKILWNSNSISKHIIQPAKFKILANIIHLYTMRTNTA